MSIKRKSVKKIKLQLTVTLNLNPVSLLSLFKMLEKGQSDIV